jgi:hypothetical protein
MAQSSLVVVYEVTSARQEAACFKVTERGHPTFCAAQCVQCCRAGFTEQAAENEVRAHARVHTHTVFSCKQERDWKDLHSIPTVCVVEGREYKFIDVYIFTYALKCRDIPHIHRYKMNIFFFKYCSLETRGCLIFVSVE